MQQKELQIKLAFLRGKVDALRNLADYFETFTGLVVKKDELIQGIRSSQYSIADKIVELEEVNS